jgi:hypothetical protein
MKGWPVLVKKTSLKWALGIYICAPNQSEDTPRHAYAISKNRDKVWGDMRHGGVRICEEDLENVKTRSPGLVRLPTNLIGYFDGSGNTVEDEENVSSMGEDRCGAGRTLGAWITGR